MKVNERLKALLKTPRVLGFFSMSSATLFAQILTISILPLLSRLYTPTDFGVLSLVMALTAIIAPAVALRFDTVVLLTRSNRQTRAVVTLALLIIVTASIAWALLSKVVSGFFFVEHLPPYLGLWVFAITLLTGLFSLFSHLALRELRYRHVAERTLLQSLGTALGQLSFGLLLWGYSGLLAGHLLGRATGLVKLISTGRNYIARHRLREVLAPFREYWRFPVVFAPSAILNSLGAQLPLVTLTALYGVEFGGQLGMAERIVSVPIAIVGNAVGQMFVAELSKMRREKNNDYLRFFLQLTAILAGLSIFGFGALALTAQELVPWVLGVEWESTASFVQILALMGSFQLIAIPLARAISVFQRARANLLIDIIRIVLMTASISLVLLASLSTTMSVWLIYGALSTVYLITWLYVLGLLRKESHQ